jgi:molecular chaperone DnaK
VAHVVGIDLGTTNSLVAHMRGDRPEIIANEGGKRLTPSIVGLDRHDKIHVGDTAKNQLVAMPDRTVAEVKRLMGSSSKLKLGAREYTPQEVSAFILKRLKDDAERFLGESVAEAVITVPAYFTDAQRQATKDAGELAGFRVDRILNEPTAAALAYGLDHLDKEQFVLVFDLGGGTFDVSVLEMFEGVLDVKASSGNNHLGGGDFDRAVADWLALEFEKAHGLDLRKDVKAMVRLKAAAEQAKIELSSMSATTIMLPFLAVAKGGAEPLSLEMELTRQKLEELIGPMIRSTIEPVETALRDAKLDKSRITDVVLVGGSSRIPLVQSLLHDYFGKEARRGVHPDEAIALGAAVQA